MSKSLAFDTLDGLWSTNFVDASFSMESVDTYGRKVLASGLVYFDRGKTGSIFLILTTY